MPGGRKRAPCQRDEACNVCGHYHDYLGGEPCAVCGHALCPEENKVAIPSSLPSEVLPGFLFLGSYDHASRAELLKALGIGHILNTVPACQNLYKNSFDYYTVSASPPPFEECFQWLEKVRVEGGKVLVHCMSGMSQSPSVVIYYLMRHRGWRLSESYSWVKDRKSAINMKAADAQRLQEAEVQLLGAGASHFQIPLSLKAQQAAAAAQHAQQQGAGPFSWPGGISMHATTGGTPAVTFNPQQPAALNFVPQAAAAVQQQQQQQQQAAAGGGGGSLGGAGGFVFGAPPQQQLDAMLD